MIPDLKKYILHFLRQRGIPTGEASFHQLQGDGSKRIFWRITPSKPGTCFVAMANPPTDHAAEQENIAYIKIGEHLYRKGIPVPEMYTCNLERGWFIMEDMGDINLQDFLSSLKDPLPVYQKVLEHLLRSQIEGARGFDPTWCCQTQRYDRTVMRQYEANYFRDAFLCLYLGLKKEWPELEAPFDHLAENASMADSTFFLHRDFQSRNIMVSKGNIGFIDWQGGRLGPLGYDLASLLIDPYVRLSLQQREALYQSYLALIRGYNPGWIDSFKRSFMYLAIQRNLQILGAFSYLTRIMNKLYFEDYIPAALASLDDLLHRINDPELSPLRDLISCLQVQKKSLDMPGPKK